MPSIEEIYKSLKEMEFPADHPFLIEFNLFSLDKEGVLDFFKEKFDIKTNNGNNKPNNRNKQR